MNLNNLPVNIFDGVVLVVCVLGLLRGRKHGMSEELMLLIQWLGIVIVGALVWRPLGNELASSSPFSHVAAFLIAYISVALVITGIFALVKYRIGSKLVGSDVFGRAEYYLGMGSGVVRFGCMLLVALSLLNARYFSPKEVTDMVNFQNDVYGSNFFPTWHTAQEMVFERSASGGWIKQHLAFFLIEPTVPEDRTYHQKEAELP